MSSAIFGSLTKHCWVKIKRSNGKVHLANVQSFTEENRTVLVEWFENEDIKGKELRVGTIFALNPEYKTEEMKEVKESSTSNVTTNGIGRKSIFIGKREMVDLLTATPNCPHITDPYLKQGEDQSQDGQHRASEWILQHSLFFKEKIEGCKRMGNELKFDYTEWPVKTIRTFLDLMHGIEKTGTELSTTLSLIRFLQSEGKVDLDGNGKPISAYEHAMINDVSWALEKANLTMEEKVLAGLVLDLIDSYDGCYLKNVLMKCDLQEVLLACHTIDMFSEEHKPITQMLASEKMTDENMDQIEFEIENKLIWFARKLTKMSPITIKMNHVNFPRCYFELVVFPSMTAKQFSKAVATKHNSINNTGEAQWDKIKFTHRPGWRGASDKTLKELGFSDKNDVLYSLRS